MQSKGIVVKVPFQSWSKARDKNPELHPEFMCLLSTIQSKRPEYIIVKNVKGVRKLSYCKFGLELMKEYGYNVCNTYLQTNDETLVIAIKNNE